MIIRFQMGSSFNPLASILKDNKLTRMNYKDSKRNLGIFITAKDFKFVLMETFPTKLKEGSSKRDVQNF